MPRLYNLNDWFFADLSKETAAYWFGVLSAGGYLIPPNGVGIEISTRDRDWLCRFKSDLKFEGKIYTYSRSKFGRGNGGDRSRMVFTSQQIYSDLMGLGLQPNKTNTLEFCRKLPYNSYRHYIRGIIDGDGSLCYNSKRRQWRLSVRGTSSVISGICEFIYKETDLPFKEAKWKESTFYVEYYGNRMVRKVCDILYEDCSVYLVRKKQLSDEVF